ncbi:hypothetical protein HYALB_00003910 [Hymenoscyphus albidus]|uniref:Uncharacterized protein n=1 Tax=Hymenoscyphus albidus TaxID=595503 RepID=A0A9N9Q953_9HELO|nr:hypothetical protein HYALB_00003910 [Hymenoscyphus albidus]
MAPTKPTFTTAGQAVISASEGAITTTFPKHPKKAFAFLVEFNCHHPRLLALADKKPPMHFHPYQTEDMEVLEGRLTVEAEGVQNILTPESGVFAVKPWTNHRLYPPPVTDEIITKFILSGSDTEESYKMDGVFFQNWYGYQDQVVLKGEKIDLLQVMSMFDAGGSYLSLPWYIPFSRTISMAMSIFLGRWVGGLLGYQPFYKEWTNEWDIACEKMSESRFQKRFAKS